MYSRLVQICAKVLVSLVCGLILRTVVGLHPVWWAVWLAPALLLILGIRFPLRDARWMVPLSAVTAASVNFHYFRLVMPFGAVVASIVELSLLWVLLSSRLTARFSAKASRPSAKSAPPPQLR